MRLALIYQKCVIGLKCTLNQHVFIYCWYGFYCYHCVSCLQEIACNESYLVAVYCCALVFTGPFNTWLLFYVFIFEYEVYASSEEIHCHGNRGEYRTLLQNDLQVQRFSRSHCFLLPVIATIILKKKNQKDETENIKNACTAHARALWLVLIT